MKDKIYDAYFSRDYKLFNKILERLSVMYHDDDSFRVVDLCNDFGITCGVQSLDNYVTSYAAFNTSIQSRLKNDKFIIVEKKLDLKEKRLHYAYHFFQYIFNDNIENYEVTKLDYKNKEYYDNAIKILLPKKKILKDYKSFVGFYGEERSALLKLSDKYLVPYEDVKRRIIDITIKNDKNILFKKIKKIKKC